MKLIKPFVSIIMLFTIVTAKAQVGIGTTNPNTSAQLDVSSTTKGFLPPRVTFSQRNDIATPAAGLLVYCIDCGTNGEMQYYNGINWVNMTGSTATFPPFAGLQVGNDIDGEAADDQSGTSVSLSANGNRVAIGAPFNDGTGITAGQVRIYNWSGTAWAQIGTDLDGEAAGDRSGTAVSLSADGNRVAIGAPINAGNGSFSGHVRIYNWNGTAWVQLGTDIDGEAANDQSGSSVSLSADGSRVAIGAIANNGGGIATGHVRIYNWNGTAWVQQGMDINGEASNDQSGSSVSLSADGNRVAIGAKLNDGNGNSAGNVRIYSWNGAAWIQQGTDIDGEAANDQSGSSVSISADGNRVAIGATGNNGNGSLAGHVRIYNWNGTAWVQLGLDLDGEASGDQSGVSVSISGDGSLVAIGATGNDGNGSTAGHVRIYKWSGTVWMQQSSDIDGEAAFDQCGISVALSADGGRVAIGARLNDGGENSAGHVRVYQ